MGLELSRVGVEWMWQGTVVNIVKSYLDASKPIPGQAATHLQLTEQPSPSEVVLTSFPSMNPMSAARLISLGCSLSELLTLSADEQKQLAVKLSDIPTNSLELFFQQAMWGQAITGQLPTAPGQGPQLPALEYNQQHTLGHDRQTAHTDELHTNPASLTQQHEYIEPHHVQSRQLAGLQSGRHTNLLGTQATPLIPHACSHTAPHPAHAPRVARTGNPFQTFQYQPQRQVSSRPWNAEQLHQQLPPGYAHGHRQHGLSYMGIEHKSDSFEIEEVPHDYTDEYMYDSLAPPAECSQQQQQQQPQQWQQQHQQHDVDWQSYLPEEEAADDTFPEQSMPWQQAGHQPSFVEEHSGHAGAAGLHNLTSDHMGDDGVPDVVVCVDDASEGILLQQLLLESRDVLCMTHVQA